MGKGNRNRTTRVDVAPSKKKSPRAHKPLPKWLIPAISLVVVVAIVAAIVLVALSNNGTFKRTNILVKSKTGHYNINQQMAYFLVWNSVYEQAAQTWETYESYSEGLAAQYTGYQTEFEYCWNQSFYAVRYNLNTYINDYFGSVLKSYVAVCDEGETNLGISLTADEKKDAKSSLLATVKNRAYDYYNYLYSAGLSTISASYVYSSGYPYFGQYWDECFGSDFKQKDMENVAVLEAMAQKVLNSKQDTFWTADEANVIAYRDANPESFYLTKYLTYATEDAAFAATLAGKTDAESFKTAVVENYVDVKLPALYDKYGVAEAERVSKKASDLKTALSGKTTTEALGTALTEQGMTTADYNDESDLDSVLKAWLLDSSRAAYNAETLTSADGKSLYVAVISAKGENSVTAAFKKLDFAALPSSITDQKTTLVNTLLANLKVVEEAAGEVLKTADAKADEMLESLNAGGDKTALTETASDFTAATETVPAVIRTAVFADGVESGKAIKASEGNTRYVIFVTSLTTGETPTATVSYLKIDGMIEDVLAEMESGLGSVLPAEKTANYLTSTAARLEKIQAELNKAEDLDGKKSFMTNNYATEATGVTAENKASLPDEVHAAVTAAGVEAGSVLTADKADSYTKYLILVTAKDDTGMTVSYLTVSTYEKDSFEEWLFKDVDATTLAVTVHEGDTFTVAPTDTDTSSHVYLIVGTPMSLETETVIRGGYVAFSDEAAANEALASLSALEGLDKLNALAALNTSAVTSNALKKESVTDANLSEWMFGTRSAGDAAVITASTSSESDPVYYLAVVLDQLESWESTARSNYATEQLSDWMDELVEIGEYKLSERAMKRVKQKKLEAEATTEATV